ncbi:HisA/HisF-related TIM barrel protein [Veillonella sp.]|uniref:HisA/HisF-related TIM barrel protein n=1 Tax=Veillonella sp. TaxID=1926307 RepID=UPI003521383D
MACIWQYYGRLWSDEKIGGPQCKNALEWVKEAVGHGMGELLVTSIDRHGTGLGFDIELYQALAEVVDVPVTAFGGAGNIQYFVDLFTKTNVTRALVGALLHNKVLTIKDIKKALHKSGVVVRQ